VPIEEDRCRKITEGDVHALLKDYYSEITIDDIGTVEELLLRN
jgi:hypothetical protein